MSEVSVPRSGMTTDLNTINLDGSKYPYALNAVVESISQEGNFLTIQNEGSNRLAVSFPAGFIAIGVLPVNEQHRTIYFLVNPTTGESQIGEARYCQFDDYSDDSDGVACADCEYPVQVEAKPLEQHIQSPYCAYRPIVTSDCLLFNVDYPVRAQYSITDCSLNVYFTDNTNQRRFAYFDYDADGNLVIQDRFKTIIGYTSGDCPEPIYADVIDCNKLAYHPQYGLPCLKVLDVISGGSLKAGVYQFFLAYSDYKGTLLSYYFPATHPTPIFTKQITFETNYTTDQAIVLKLEGIDKQLYSHFTVVVAETVDNFTVFKEAGTFSTTKSTLIYTGNEEGLKKLTSDDVFFRTAFYNTAGNITSANNYLFFSELQQFPKPNLQRAANKVKAFWQTVAIPEAVYKEPTNTYRYKGYNRDEVYALGLMYIADNGEEYGPYHIPGPSKSDFAQYGFNVDTLVNNNDVVKRDNCANVKCCEDEDDTIKTATITLSCSDNGCTNQGVITANFTFSEVTTTPIVLRIGAIVQYTNDLPTVHKVFVGSDLFTPPTGVTPWLYYNPTVNKPFEIIIPAGVTTYSVTDILQQDAAVGDNPWICQSCDLPVKELWVKASDPTQLRINFTNSQGITMHNLINPGQVVTTDCVDCDCESDTNAVSAVVTTACDCSNGGHTRLTFNLTTALPTPVTIHIGQITTQPLTSPVATGYDIFTLPPGVSPWNLYNNPGRPFEVIIPAGVTTYTTGDIEISAQTLADANSKVWQCDLCGSQHLFYPTELFFKTMTPGIHVTFTTGDTIIVNTVDTATGGDPVPCNAHNYWETYNTGFVIGTPHQLFVNCDVDSMWEWGHFAYWESIDRYPNDYAKWGELCGKPIRHHKFPDSVVTHIHDGLNGTKKFNDNNIVYPIGVLIDHDSVILGLDQAVTDGIMTAEERARIKEYRVIRGNRVGNKSVIAKGLLYDMWQYQKNGLTHFYPNYGYNDLHPDNFISNAKTTYGGSNTSDPIPNSFVKSSRYTFHSPDTHFVNPAIGTELKLETLEYGESEGFFNKCDEQAKYRFLSAFAMTLAFGAGMAAAFSAEKEKECKTVVLKSETTIGVTAGVTTGSLGLLAPTQILDYGELSGQPDLLSAGTNFTAGEVHKTTCKGKPFQLLNILSGNPAAVLTGGVMQIPYLFVIGLREMDIISTMLKSLIPLKNMAIQYNSVGKYSNYKLVANETGNKIRGILRSAYLDPMVQMVNEAITDTTNNNVRINNWHRERSVYLKVDHAKAFPNPIVLDDSRVTMDQLGLNQDDLGKRVYRTISSYYASIKDYVPDQYGRISDIEYVDTEACSFKLAVDYPLEAKGIFGGDTFIGRFALKRKMPFFLQTRFRVINEGDVTYSELGNVGYPNYYFNTEQPLFERMANIHISSISSIGSAYTALIGVARTRLDAKETKAFYQSGYIHLYHYGIPYFFAESDVNVDYRHGENNKEKDFYPHNQDLEYWLQENNVPISEDNYYLYNKTYSKQNKESPIGIEADTLKDEMACRVNNQTRVIYSDQSNSDGSVDEWLTFRANNFKDFNISNGRIVGIDGIENDKVLVRFENTTKIFNAYSTLQTSTGDVVVSNGGMFNTPPQEFAHTALGYAGSQHVDMLKTEFGHIWVDAKRGQVFNLAPNAKGLDEITREGMNSWFKANLPFQLMRDFPTISMRDVDNNFKGVGIAMAFDKRFNRILITKLDYRKIHSGVVYDAAQKKFKVNGVEVELSDTKYFCNRSWTISYNLLTKSWVSFHSYLPNFYIDYINHFDSGTKSGVWSHNLTNKSFQVYYGKLYPFVVEVLSDPSLMTTTLNSIEFETEAIRYHNGYDTAVSDVTFNKAWVYNERQHSGLLKLVPRDEGNIYQSLQYPFVQDNMINILLTNKDSRFRFNQFYDTVNSQKSNVPFIVNTCNNADKVVNPKALNYYKTDIDQAMIRGKQTRVRLINDDKSNYKLLFYFVHHDQTPSVI